jgi:hypothetical protein
VIRDGEPVRLFPCCEVTLPYRRGSGRRIVPVTSLARDPDYLIEVGQTTLPGGWRQFLNS